jgi:hypothetical protein
LILAFPLPERLLATLPTLKVPGLLLQRLATVSGTLHLHQRARTSKSGLISLTGEKRGLESPLFLLLTGAACLRLILIAE